MRTKLVSLFSLLLVASFVLAACTTPEPAVVTVVVGGEVQVVTVTPGAEPPGPKVLRYAYGTPGDVPTLDPNLATDTSSVTFVNDMTIGLTWLDERDASLHPGMAESWDMSDDGLTYTYHLREGFPWVRYDGTAVVNVLDCEGNPRMVTAHDFEYSLKRALDPATASDYAYVLAFAIKGGGEFNSGEGTVDDVAVTAIDDYTLEVTFNEDVAYNNNIMSLWTGHAVPRWIIEGDDCTEARADRWSEPGFHQSYGPFVLKDWVHDSYITMMKNPMWPTTPEIPMPNLDEVNWLLALDDAAALAEYEAGRVDAIDGFPSADQDRIQADPVLSKELVIAPVLCTYYYGFNTKAPFVDDVRVRRALSMAINRQALIDNVLKGGQEPAQWFARPGLNSAPTMETHPDLGIKYDPAAAKAEFDAYLAEKGLTADQVDITLMFNTSAGHQRIAEAIQQMWKDALGLTVQLTNQEWAVFLKTIRDPVATPQIYRLGWCADYPDANNFTREVFIAGGSAQPVGGGGINWDGGNYAEFEALVLEAATEQDPAKRVELYAQAEEILVATDAAIAPIYFYTDLSMTKPYVTRTQPVTGHNDFTFWDMNK